MMIEERMEKTAKKRQRIQALERMYGGGESLPRQADPVAQPQLGSSHDWLTC